MRSVTSDGFVTVTAFTYVFTDPFYVSKFLHVIFNIFSVIFSAALIDNQSTSHLVVMFARTQLSERKGRDNIVFVQLS